MILETNMLEATVVLIWRFLKSDEENPVGAQALFFLRDFRCGLGKTILLRGFLLISFLTRVARRFELVAPDEEAANSSTTISEIQF